MSKKSSRTKPRAQTPQSAYPLTSLLDQMNDGVEFESLVEHKVFSIDIGPEIRRSLEEIKALRNRPAICYLANVINSNLQASVAIDVTDDLPFSEMISTVPECERNLDVIMVTPGGSAEQVAKFVDKLRPRFDHVAFILPYMAMSAGTIFAMSGNDIIMGSNSYIGPTDPQVRNKDGAYVPAQALLALIQTIQDRGEKLISDGDSPRWSDLYILNQLDGEDIGNAMSASSTDLPAPVGPTTSV